MAPGGQLMLLGQWKIFLSSHKSYTGHPRFYRFTALASLLESTKVYNSIDLPLAPYPIIMDPRYKLQALGSMRLAINKLYRIKI